MCYLYFINTRLTTCWFEIVHKYFMKLLDNKMSECMSKKYINKMNRKSLI